MSRTRDPRTDAAPGEALDASFDASLEADARRLREPAQPLPESLRRSLLAIPGSAASEEFQESDRLYGIALEAADLEDDAPEDANLEDAALGTSPVRAAVVRLLAAVVRDARSRRPLPPGLHSNLRQIPERISRRAPRTKGWKARWVTEPRWAAAACWLLAFALTLGTGDAVAGLLDAPQKIHATSTHWAGRLVERTAESLGAASAASSTVRRELGDGVDLFRTRAGALAARAESWSARRLRDVEEAWDHVSQNPLSRELAPRIELDADGDSNDSNNLDSKPTNPGDPSPEEARDDR